MHHGILVSMIELCLHIGFAIFVYMTVFFIVSLLMKDASIVDIAWGLGFIVVTTLCVLLTERNTALITLWVIILIWGLRLSWHILQRKLKRPGEDFRYAAWRKDWGNTFVWRSYLQVFVLQGIIMFIISLPILAVASAGHQTIQAIALCGICIWILGFLFESIADAEMSRFKINPSNKGKIITSGLWKYSRHPNYFGESLQWWGVWVIAVGSSGVWWTIISPLLLTYLLLFVSGVPMLEKKYAGNKDFEIYKKQTSVFIPWFPRS
jgi:steroid 5-alpha reductase family enzyme